MGEGTIVRSVGKSLSLLLIVIAIFCIVPHIGEGRSDNPVDRRILLEIDKAIVEGDIIRFQKGEAFVDGMVIKAYPALNSVLIEVPSRKDLRFIKKATRRIILTRDLQDEMTERSELIEMGDKAVKSREYHKAAQFFEHAAKIEIYHGYDDGLNSKLRTANAHLGRQTKSIVKLVKLENVQDSDIIRFLRGQDFVDAKVIGIYVKLSRVMVEVLSEEHLKFIEETERTVILTRDLQEKISERKRMIKMGDESSERKEYGKAAEFYKEAARIQIYDGYDDGAREKFRTASRKEEERKISEKERQREEEVQPEEEMQPEEEGKVRRSLFQRIKEFIMSKIRRQ